MKNTPRRIILMGIQGSGKGTQAHLLVEDFGFALFETGAELRKIAESGSKLGNAIKERIDAGHYVPSEYIRDVIEDFLAKNQHHTTLFDSPVRSSEQDRIITPMLGEFEVIHLELDPDLAIERLMHRRVDSITGEVFPASFVGDTNPRTGNPLTVRKDDNIESIRNRIEYSTQETLPIIAEWEKQGRIVHHINANQSVETIHSIITSLISL